MKIAALIFTILFIIFSFLELYFCFKENDKYRKFFKTFCVGFLAIIAILLLPDHPLVYVALIFGTIGDLLLIFKNDKTFALGTASFLVGHLFYYSELFINQLHDFVPAYFYIIITFSIGAIAIIISKKFQTLTSSNVQAFGGSFYLSFLIHALLLMILSTIFNPTGFMYFGIIGYALFVSSDIILIYCKFKKNIRHHDFAIMLTYILAQAFILLGFLLTYNVI